MSVRRLSLVLLLGSVTWSGCKFGQPEGSANLQADGNASCSSEEQAELERLKVTPATDSGEAKIKSDTFQLQDALQPDAGTTDASGATPGATDQARREALEARCTPVVESDPEEFSPLTMEQYATFQKTMEEANLNALAGGPDSTAAVEGLALADVETPKVFDTSGKRVEESREIRVEDDSFSVSLKIRAPLVGSAGATRAINMTRTFTAKAVIEGDGDSIPLWTGAPGNDSAAVANLRNRNFVRHKCFLSVELTIADKASLDYAGGVDVGFVSVNSTVASAATKARANVFIMESDWTQVNHAAAPGGVGPSAASIEQACRDYAKRMKADKGLESDIARRTSGWAYVNDGTTCLEDTDCDAWHGAQLPGVVAWTVARCVTVNANKANAYRACANRSKKGGTCTPDEAAYHVPFSFRCDAGLKCQYYSSGSWIFKKEWGGCE